VDFQKLPKKWEKVLSSFMEIKEFYEELELFLKNRDVFPEKDKIFNVFHKVSPEKVQIIFFGEDPYLRKTSANGIAFYDEEIRTWTDKTRGNSLKNILKALLIEKKLASYQSDISECREIVKKHNFPNPPKLFEKWLNSGVFLLNTSLTFENSIEKKKHFKFWEPFLEAVAESVLKESSPYVILWGKKAQNLEQTILKNFLKSKLIRQGHPTFGHQFMKKEDIFFSPFTEIIEKTGLQWL
jgi:uracil-DNA glycosylase